MMIDPTRTAMAPKVSRIARNTSTPAVSPWSTSCAYAWAVMTRSGMPASPEAAAALTAAASAPGASRIVHVALGASASAADVTNPRSLSPDSRLLVRSVMPTTV